MLRKIGLQVVLPDNHRLALREQIELSELADESFIGFTERNFAGRNETICKACSTGIRLAKSLPAGYKKP